MGKVSEKYDVGAYVSLKKSVAEAMLGSGGMSARVGTDVSDLLVKRAHERNLIAANHWAACALRLLDIDGALLAARWRRRFSIYPLAGLSALQVAA